jgi:hypothetical protein
VKRRTGCVVRRRTTARQAGEHLVPQHQPQYDTDCKRKGEEKEDYAWEWVWEGVMSRGMERSGRGALRSSCMPRVMSCMRALGAELREVLRGQLLANG